MPNLLKLASAALGSGLTSLSLFKKQCHARMDCENQVMFQPPYSEHTQWQQDWDGFHNEYALKGGEARKDKPKGVRNIIFVRSAQHKICGSDTGLTDTGKKQAEEFGKFLAGLGNQFPIEETDVKVVSSSEQFSQETAMKALNIAGLNAKGELDSRLNSGTPLRPSPLSYNEPKILNMTYKQRENYERETKERTDTKRKQLDEFFSETFFRSTNDRSTFELYFCENSIIYFLSLKLLQLPLNTWSRFSAHNCSIAWFKIKPDGRVSCVTFGNNGFLPQEMWTEY